MLGDSSAARWRRPTLAVLGGALVAFSMPPWGFWPLAFVGVVLFEIALGTTPTRRDRAIAGFAFGIPWFVIAMAWMWFLTAPGYLIAAVLFALLHSLAAVLAPVGAWRAVGRPAAHTLVEAVRIVFPFGGVPLATIGISQADGPLLGLARLGGVLLITWAVFQVGFALARPIVAVPQLIRKRQPDEPREPHGAIALAALSLIFVIAAFAPTGRELPGSPTVTVAAVQGGGEQGTSALDVPSSVVTGRLLEATATIEPGDAELVVWPENGVDVNGIAFADSAQYALIAAEARRLDVPFMVGVTEDSEFANDPVPDRFVNAHVAITPDGDVIGRYEKVRRVPFGEYVPFRSILEALGAPLDRVAGDAVSGSDPAQLVLPDGTSVGVMISWEVFFDDRARDANSNGATFLINPTNGASYTGTILQTQQVASSRLRAMENGRWVVQVSPTGFSAFVSPDGDVFDRTDISEQRVIIRDVPLREGTTWYRSIGDWPWRLAALAVFGVAWWHSGLGAKLRARRDRVTPRSSA
ncbi:MAG TPA: apolipoprotein N-acyltransferase [Ilumatobacter sp.]|nr:apolipoprotein N-acyltransferase [Ilumatobacter sp.]